MKPDVVNDPVGYAVEVVGKDPMAAFLGIAVEEAREGYARCSVTVKPEYCNAMERAHGAIIHAVADQAFAVACNSTGTTALALTLTIHYQTAGLEGERLFAEATPVNTGRKISLWEIKVRGSEDRLIATAEGTAYHK